MLADSIASMGFVSTFVDPDVWRRRARKPDNSEYCELLLTLTLTLTLNPFILHPFNPLFTSTFLLLILLSINHIMH